MSVFAGYARYYDLFYRDKDYVAETRFVEGLLKEHAPRATSLLELGCGTGGHAECLANRGLNVHGVDMSDEMLAQAKRRFAALPDGTNRRLSLDQADIRTLRLNRTFDAVLALFHVVSYQTKNADLLATFATARAHLRPGGLFLFDCWYGPAVLTDRPRRRTKRCEDEALTVTRSATPTMHPEANTVEVAYRIVIRDKQRGGQQRLSENHRMRYLFRPELEYFLEQSGLQPLTFGEWLTGAPAGFSSWSVYCVARAV